MLSGKRSLAVAIATPLVLFASACNDGSPPSTAPQESKQALSTADSTLTNWQPKWNTLPDKTKKEKTPLVAKVAFADEGFAGSPVPENPQQRTQDKKVREAFAQSFQSEPECVEMTLMQKNPQDADFRFQVFSGLDGRTGRLQWVLYRMDVSGELSHGETTGSLNSITKSVCESMRPLVSLRGGNVQ